MDSDLFYFVYNIVLHSIAKKKGKMCFYRFVNGRYEKYYEGYLLNIQKGACMNIT